MSHFRDRWGRFFISDGHNIDWAEQELRGAENALKTLKNTIHENTIRRNTVSHKDK